MIHSEGTIGGERGGFSLIELLVVIGVIGVLTALVFPSLSRAESKALRISCASQLRQVGQAMHEFGNDHQDKLPPHVEVSDGGTRTIGEAWAPFAALSNELVSAKLLVCPSDHRRRIATDFSSLNGGFSQPTNRNLTLSYFVGTHARIEEPESLLAGDRNIENRLGEEGCGPAELTGGATALDPAYAPGIKWNATQHGFAGNFCVADGSIRFTSNTTLFQSLSHDPFMVHDSLSRNHVLLP